MRFAPHEGCISTAAEGRTSKALVYLVAMREVIGRNKQGARGSRVALRIARDDNMKSPRRPPPTPLLSTA
ncbi:hypothetical protein D8674_005302 [Pyrus ussuriensis x Pyrus communis]|uniref:Uncharacterized protein n=1 Tax=Pyrus ussuriensis x Pyrus communis TaxID=2448454 RepID=A0A5N5FR62_9ROSA|nr:hypothetical protein D8674_005302 [Pyrus ussuriensis x Pyrus communis]